MIFAFDLDGTVIKKKFARYFWYFVIPYILLKKRGWSFYESISFLLKAYRGMLEGYPKPETREWYYVKPWFEALFDVKDDPLEFIKENFTDFEEKMKIHLEFEDGFLEIINEIRKKHKTILITNMDSSLYRKFIHSKVSRFFDKVYLTHELNKEKWEILKELKEKGEGEVFYIGDELSDVESSRRAGVVGVLYDKYGKYRYHPKIRSLLELRRWI